MSSAAKRRSPIPCMDGLRGLTCMMVLVAHMMHYFLPRDSMLRTPTVAMGKTGILMFFVLSGFMMIYHYFTPQQFSVRYWGAFAARRFFRIIPAYVLTVLVYCLFSDITGMKWSSLVNYLFLFEYDTRTHLWSIPPEIKFYLLFPVISCALWLLPFHNQGKLALLAVAWIVLSLTHYDLPQRALAGNLKAFIAGITAAYLYIRHRPAMTPDDASKVILAALAAMALILLTFGTEDFIFPNGAALRLLTLPCAVILLLAPLSGKGISRFLTSPALRYCGKISYSLYLMHPLVILTCLRYFGKGSFSIFIVGGSMIWLVAVLMQRYVEAPANSLGKKLSGKLLP